MLKNVENRPELHCLTTFRIPTSLIFHHLFILWLFSLVTINKFPYFPLCRFGIIISFLRFPQSNSFFLQFKKNWNACSSWNFDDMKHLTSNWVFRRIPHLEGIRSQRFAPHARSIHACSPCMEDKCIDSDHRSLHSWMKNLVRDFLIFLFIGYLTYDWLLRLLQDVRPSTALF